MTLTTREARQGDLADVASLFDQYRQFYEQAPNAQRALQFITERFTRQESVLLVAQDASGTLVGFCQLYPSFCSVEAQPVYVLYDLFVAPGARKRGAGRQLLLAAEARARVDGKVRMDLTTARTNFQAQSVYESLGWVRDEVFYAYNRHLESPS